jgi:hypothetical protein
MKKSSEMFLSPVIWWINSNFSKELAAYATLKKH